MLQYQRRRTVMKLLLHICCAPCSVACIKSLRQEGIEPTGYWYNPNIHPFTEYRARRDTLVGYAQTIGMALCLEDEYGLRPFTRAVAEDIGGRCLLCYAARMRATARYAAEHGFTHFSSTLFISPYQRHELLRAAAEQAAEEFGVTFLYRDFRPLFVAGQEEARTLELYIQKYCGCVFSEEERYSKVFRKKAANRLQTDLNTETGLLPRTPTDAESEALRRIALPALRVAGLRFEAARAAIAGAANAEPVPPPLKAAPIKPGLPQ
jgi:epoxyqueuosine reductase